VVAVRDRVIPGLPHVAEKVLAGSRAPLGRRGRPRRESRRGSGWPAIPGEPVGPGEQDVFAHADFPPGLKKKADPGPHQRFEKEESEPLGGTQEFGN